MLLPDNIDYQIKSPAEVSYLFSSCWSVESHRTQPQTLQDIVAAWGYSSELDVRPSWWSHNTQRVQYDHWPARLIPTGYFSHSERFHASYQERKVINSFTQLCMLQAIEQSDLVRYVHWCKSTENKGLWHAQLEMGRLFQTAISSLHFFNDLYVSFPRIYPAHNI